MDTLTGWVLRHRRWVVGAWVLLTLGGAAASTSLNAVLAHSFAVPGREGYDTDQIVQKTFGSGAGLPPLVPVVSLPQGRTVASPETMTQLGRAFAAISASLPGARTASFVSTGSRAFVSGDGRTTFALVFPHHGAEPDLSPSALHAATRAAAVVKVAGRPVRLTGIDALSHSSGGSGPGVLLEVLIGALGALVVLVYVFASWVAVLPLLIAVVSIETTFLLLRGLAAFTSVSFVVQFIVGLIGLGISIDYALLVVVRWREERERGARNEDAVRAAMQTAGRAVLFSGTTVGIGLLALVVLPVPFLRSIGYGGVLIPVVTVLVATTLLPVILATIGPRLDARPLRKSTGADRAWARWATLIVRHRFAAAALALAALLLLAIPALHIYPGDPRANALALNAPPTARQALTSLQRAGIPVGVLTPFDGIVSGNGATTANAGNAAGAVEGVRAAVAPAGPDWRQQGTAVIEVMPISDGNSSAGRATLSAVRAATHSLAGAPRYGGQAAQGKDFVNAVYGNFPLMLALIIMITYVLLARAFRSLILPLKAVLLNLLSVAATYGMLVLIWQDGHGSKLIWGINATGAITQWVPLTVFAFLFGLSMDYEVFILSRIREEYDQIGDTHTAVIRGLGRTGRLITSAATILFMAFVALASGPDTDLKIFATGLALGIAIDATIVRSVLVPALIAIFDRWNWWMPDRVQRILRTAAPTRASDASLTAQT
jgi:putative drug exporter of the RND superfamily